MFTRRNLLQGLTAAALGAVTQKVSADGEQGLPPKGTPGVQTRVLEIFLRGGASFWGSFWHDAALGGSSGTKDLSFDASNWPLITGGPTPPGNLHWQGRPLGRAAAPMARLVGPPGAQRTLGQHMRVVRIGHDLIPHELAIPYAITGTRFGRQGMFGLGPAIWHHAATTGPFPRPQTIRSLIFQTGTNDPDDNAAGSAAITGAFGEAFRPPIIPIGDPNFHASLLRAGFTETDALKSFYQARYREQLVKDAVLTRSAGWSTYGASLDMMIDRHLELHALLDGQGLFTPVIAPDYHTSNRTRAAINGALNLLTAGRVDHVAVIDGGVETNYDTHAGNATNTFEDDSISTACVHAGNIWNVCDTLARRLPDILDGNVTVLINTEFGRIQKGGDELILGTEHHPQGYVNVIVSPQIQSPGYVGNITGSRGEVASALCVLAFPPPSVFPTVFTPTDVYAALADLVGIDPWGAGMYDASASCLGSPQSSPAATLLGV